MLIRARLQRWRFAITAALLALLLILFQVPARAAGGGDGCNPGRSSNYVTYYFSGTDDTSFRSSYGGIYGNIHNYSPYVPSSTDDTSQWVMLDNFNDYAQIGWYEAPGSVRHTFVQFSDKGVAFWTNFFPPFTLNSDPEYEVDYNPSCPSVGCFAFYANGTWKTSSAHTGRLMTRKHTLRYTTGLPRYQEDTIINLTRIIFTYGIMPDHLDLGTL